MISTKCYLDANFLIYFLDSTSLHHQSTLKAMTRLIDQSYIPCISSLVLDEVMYIIQKYTRMQKKSVNPFIVQAMKRIQSIPQMKLLPIPSTWKDQYAVAGYMKTYKLNPRDAYHLLVMKSYKVRICATFDQDFSLLYEKRVLQPFTS